IRARDADTVCLQEIPWTWEMGSGAQYLAERTGLNHAYLRANGNRYALTFEMGQAILSRFPLEDTSFIELEPRSAYFEARVVLHAVVETPWGEVHAFTTHLTNKEPSVNAAQVDALTSFVDAHRAPIAVVTGDFNAEPDSVQIRALMDRWTVASPDETTCCIGDVTAGPSQRLDERIDYIFLVGGPGIEVDGSERILDAPRRVAGGWQWASDHVGLLARIRIASSE
ncbi:MAG: endonuclease/exonuclease/phosphatase family protein, partial [Myxococcota bacterium]